MASCHKIDILAITETWLLPDVADATVFIPGFHSIARTDTTGVSPKHGVGIFVNKDIPFVSIDCTCPNVHIIYIDVLKCFVIVVYRPPSNSNAQNVALVNFLTTFCPNKEIILLGDFNLPRVDWSQNSS